MNREDFRLEIIERVKELNAYEVIGSYIDLPKKSNKSYMGICPFHNDTKLGSFHVTANMYNCFACGNKGDAINFVMKYERLSYSYAALEIALTFNIISSQEYEEYFKGRKIPPRKAKQEKMIIEKEEEEIVEKLSDELINEVFYWFLIVLELSNTDKHHLNNVRKIDFDTIEKMQYKTYPNKDESIRAIDSLIKILKNNYTIEEIEDMLSKTPGFHKRKEGKRLVWDIPRNKGIIIPIRNAKGQIRGLQVRKYEVAEGQQRYTWFSSSFAIDNETAKLGTSSGTPLDIIYPKIHRNNMLFITEGRFKAEIIAERIGSIAISVQGITNYRGIEGEIKEIEKEMMKKDESFKGFSRIYIAYDNELLENENIYTNLKNMTDKIAKHHNKKIYYIYNQGKYKGIDDLIIENKAETVESIGNLLHLYKKEDFDNFYNTRTHQNTPEQSIIDARIHKNTPEQIIANIRKHKNTQEQGLKAIRICKNTQEQLINNELMIKGIQEQYISNRDFIFDTYCKFSFNTEKVKAEIEETDYNFINIECELLQMTGFEKIGTYQAKQIRENKPELVELLKEYNSLKSRLGKLKGMLKAENHTNYIVNTVDKTYYKGYSFPTNSINDVSELVFSPKLEASSRAITGLNWELITQVYTVLSEENRQAIKKVGLALDYLESVANIKGLSPEYVFLGDKAYIKRAKVELNNETISEILKDENIKEKEKMKNILETIVKVISLTENSLSKLELVEEIRETVKAEYIPF